MIEVLVFVISALVILGGGLGVILARNPVHAALSLVATLFGVAVQFISLEAYFLAAVQVIVYAGAIVVLFLFVIMLLGVDRHEDIRTEPLLGQRPLALLAGAGMLALALIVGLSMSGDVTGVPSSQASLAPADGGLAIDVAATDLSGEVTIPPQQNVREIGRSLFSTRYVFAFEVTAILLTIAVVGAVMLARKPHGELQPIPDVDPPWNYRERTDAVGDDDVDLAEGADADLAESAAVASGSAATAEPDEEEPA